MRSAAQSDRLAFAFASGYIEALGHLFPLTRGRRACLAATEEGGAHPRAIQTTLSPDGDGWRLSGTKAYVTMGTEAELLIVLASEGETDDGRNRLAAVAVPRNRKGVKLERLPHTTFVPELPHVQVVLDDVRVELPERLPGDGYTAVLKPFRTVEDLFVHGALFAWLVATLPDRAQRAELLTLLAAARNLASRPPLDPGVHVALGGLIARTRALAPTLDWTGVSDAVRERWERDQRLLEVASRARAKRFETAWERIPHDGASAS